MNRHSGYRALFFGLVVYALLLSTPVSAQTRSTLLRGTVRTSGSKLPVVGASVGIVGATFGSSTDTLGQFSIKNIPPGSYEIRVSSVGYQPTVLRDVPVREGQASVVEILLTEQLIEMSEVTTVGGRLFSIPELNVSTRFFDYREIQHTAGAFDDVLRTITILPGVAQTRVDRNDLSVRGGAPGENLNLIDGFEVENINHFGTEGSGGGTTTFLNLDFVENTFFSGGGFGAPYGDKLSSVLSVDMREGRSDRLRTKATMSATEFGVNVDGPVGQDASFLFSIRRSYLEPLFQIYGFSFAPYFYDGIGKFVYRLGTHDKLEVLGLAVVDRIDRFDKSTQEVFDNNRTILGEQTRLLAGAKWQHGVELGSLSVSGQYASSEYTYNQVGDSGASVPYNPHLYHHSTEGEASLKADGLFQVTPTTEMSFGAQGKIAFLTSAFQTTVIPTGFTVDQRVLPIDLHDDTTAYKASAYLQLSQNLAGFLVTAGVHGDFMSLIKEGWVVAPRLSASLPLDGTWKLSGSVGRYLQSPSYIWLMANPYNRGLTHIGMTQYVLGVEQSPSSDLTVTLEAYAKTYDHYPVSLTRPYIVMVNTGAEIEQIADAYAAFGLDYLQSSGTGTSRGVELFVQKRVSDSPLYGRMSATYSETQFTALDGVSRPSNDDQRWKMTLSVGYALDERWEFNAAFHFATGRPYTPFSLGGFVRSRADYNTARTNVNHELDLRASRRWALEETMITLFFDIQNVYNRKPSEPPDWDQSAARVTSPNTLGIVPSIGVSVEF